MSALQANGQKIKGDGRDRWRATCPAHGGQDLNLAVAKGDQGVLVKCWSHSCSEYDIASSVGLTLGDLFDKDGQATYDYGDGHKVIRTRDPKGKRIRQVNAPQVTHLYKPEGSAPVASSAVVVMGEGEKTADALVRLGARCVVTWPGGSSAVGKVDLTPLQGKQVIIVPDNDDPGEKAAATLVWRLQKVAASVKVWRVPTNHDGKPLNDAADLLLAGGTLDALTDGDVTPAEPVDEEFESAVRDASFIIQVREEAKRRLQEARALEVSTKLAPSQLGGIMETRQTHDWVIPDLLERGDRLVVTGSEGLGKSVLLRQIVICAAAGVHPFNATRRIDPAKVLVIDAENTELQWARGASYITRLAARLGSVNPAETVMVSAGVRIDLTTKPDANQVHDLLDRYRPDILYIGPLYKLVSKAVMTDEEAAPLIETLDSFRERGICLVMEAHAGHGKGSSGERDMRPRGSSALLGWPEFGFGLSKQDEADDQAWFSPWRGQREVRDWPKLLRRGNRAMHELDWVPFDQVAL